MPLCALTNLCPVDQDQPRIVFPISTEKHQEEPRSPPLHDTWRDIWQASEDLITQAIQSRATRAALIFLPWTLAQTLAPSSQEFSMVDNQKAQRVEGMCLSHTQQKNTTELDGYLGE